MDENPQVNKAPTSPGHTFFSVLTETIDRAIRRLPQLKEKLIKPKEVTPQIEGVVPTSGISPRTKGIVTATAAVFFILIIIVFVVTYLKGRIQKPEEEVKEEGNAVTTIIERKPSRYATDEAVLKIEADIKALEEEINKGDIEEKSLTPPILNFDVNFQE